jgi:hypothetical protein
MAIDGEPKDGDYARYIDTLVNRGAPPPGQVMNQGLPTRETPSPGQVLPEKSPRTGKTTNADSGKPAMPAKTKAAPSAAAPANAAARSTTLAAQAGKRKLSTGVALVALVIGWHAVRMIVGALEQRPIQPDQVIPGAFLLLFALMLFRISRRVRADSRRPPGPLAPLPTLDGKSRVQAKH